MRTRKPFYSSPAVLCLAIAALVAAGIAVWFGALGMEIHLRR